MGIFEHDFVNAKKWSLDAKYEKGQRYQSLDHACALSDSASPAFSLVVS